MLIPNHVARTAVLLAAAIMLPGATAALAQDAGRTCAPAEVIPLTRPEPAATLTVEPPLPEPLGSRGVVIIRYCAAHMRLTPVFGAGALTVSPRVGHVHVTVDDAPWHWADASGSPLILRGLPAGPHTVLIELVDANHQPVDSQRVRFVVPRTAANDR